MIGIYKIMSPSGKIYIGQSWNINKRFRDYRAISCKSQTKLYNSFIKHGPENHVFEKIEVLEEVTQEFLDEREIYWWLFYKEQGFNMLNIKEPGKGGKMSEESKLKISITNKGKQYFGRVVTQETRNKLSKKMKGRKLSKEMIDMLSSRRGIITHCKPILQYNLKNELLNEFPSIQEAERNINIQGANSNITACCKGKLKSAYKFIWKYKN